MFGGKNPDYHVPVRQVRGNIVLEPFDPVPITIEELYTMPLALTIKIS